MKSCDGGTGRQLYYAVLVKGKVGVVRRMNFAERFKTEVYK